MLVVVLKSAMCTSCSGKTVGATSFSEPDLAWVELSLVHYPSFCVGSVQIGVTGQQCFGKNPCFSWIRQRNFVLFAEI